MGNNTRWSTDDFKKKGLIEVNGSFVKASTEVAQGKVEKLPNLIEKAAVPGNKKVKNAVKSVNADGISFDSNLERYMYDLLTGAKINFEFQKTFELQRKFKYRDESVRAISKVVDFYLPTRNIIIDTKGFSNDVSPMKHKMLKSVLKHLHDMEPEILMPQNQKECDLLLNKLLYDKT